MKMPEGWTRLAKAVVFLRKWEEEAHQPGVDRIAVMDAPWCGDMANALGFLKDFIKLSDKILNEANSQDSNGSISLNTYKELDDLLKKVDEWR